MQWQYKSIISFSLLCELASERVNERCVSHLHSSSVRARSFFTFIFIRNDLPLCTERHFSYSPRAQRLLGFLTINLSYNRHSLGVFHLIASVVSSRLLSLTCFICLCTLHHRSAFHAHRSFAHTHRNIYFTFQRVNRKVSILLHFSNRY